jgi:hypothetical protein
MAKIDFHVETKYGTYKGAISLPGGATLTDEEIEAEKQRRVANWIALIETPAEAPAKPEEPPLGLEV